jgi:phosphoglycerate dehydrogenase-like enzyme
MHGKTIAILGVGGGGSVLARLCQVGLGMKVLGLSRIRRDCPNVDQYFGREDLPNMLSQADVVALCLPTTPETTNIINTTALAAMKPTAYLINIARGELIDEGALAEALTKGRLAGAGLDVTSNDPLPADSPLWDCPNLIITPHVAIGTQQISDDVVDFWSENIRRFAEGEPLLGLVDRQAGY